METKEKLLTRCEENFNYDTQEWKFNNITDEVLDWVLDYMRAGYPKYENEWCKDFVVDFIYELTHSKLWKITRLRMKESLAEEIECLFD